MCIKANRNEHSLQRSDHITTTTTMASRNLCNNKENWMDKRYSHTTSVWFRMNGSMHFVTKKELFVYRKNYTYGWLYRKEVKSIKKEEEICIVTYTLYCIISVCIANWKRIHSSSSLRKLNFVTWYFLRNNA